MSMSSQVVERNIHALDANIKTLNGRIDQQLKENAALRTQVAQLQAQIAALTAQMGQWQARTAGTGATT